MIALVVLARGSSAPLLLASFPSTSDGLAAATALRLQQERVTGPRAVEAYILVSESWATLRVTHGTPLNLCGVPEDGRPA